MNTYSLFTHRKINNSQIDSMAEWFESYLCQWTLANPFWGATKHEVVEWKENLFGSVAVPMRNSSFIFLQMFLHFLFGICYEYFIHFHLRIHYRDYILSNFVCCFNFFVIFASMLCPFIHLLILHLLFRSLMCFERLQTLFIFSVLFFYSPFDDYEMCKKRHLLEDNTCTWTGAIQCMR